MEGTAPAAQTLSDDGGTGKNKNQTVTAVGRELLGFIWDIAVKPKSSTSSPKQPKKSELDSRADDSARAHEKENPPNVLCGTGSCPNPRL